jgi:hypothetical protein
MSLGGIPSRSLPLYAHPTYSIPGANITVPTGYSRLSDTHTIDKSRLSDTHTIDKSRLSDTPTGG